VRGGGCAVKLYSFEASGPEATDGLPPGLSLEMTMVDAFTVENVNREDLKKGLADGTIVLVDVREPNEFADGHIPGAILNPLQSFDPDALPSKQEGKRIVLSCRSGKRSLVAMERARAAGRTDITAHYAGGMLDWNAAGEPVEE
jgi:rhodanese-related sulfurtransferase